MIELRYIVLQCLTSLGGIQMRGLTISTVAAMAALVGAPSAASASDYLVAPAPPSYYDWSGCYLGAFVGGAFTDDVSASELATSGGAGYNGTVSYGYDLDGSVIGGGLLGCNWQAPASQLVLGIEGELGGIDLNGSAAEPSGVAFTGSDTIASTSIDDIYAVFAGRIGFAADRTLFYGKAGIAFYEAESSVVDTCTVAPCGPLTISATGSSDDVTYAVGGGIEHAFDDSWLLRGEYLLLGDQSSYSACGTTSAAIFNCSPHDTDVIHTFKLGLSYKFQTFGGY